MPLNRFKDSAGRPLNSNDELNVLASSESTCVADGITLDATSVVSAISDPESFEYELFDCPLNIHRKYAYHEIITGTRSHKIGYATFSDDEVRMPTSLEKIISTYLLSDPDEKLNAGKQILFSSEKFSSIPISNSIRSAILSNYNSIFHRNDCSIYERVLDEEICQTCNRYAQQSYENYEKKYGFLELYRAMEALFLHMILRQINNDFSKKPESSLQRALEAVKKERLQLAIASQTLNQVATLDEIAHTVDKLVPWNNSFAKALQADFNRDSSDHAGVDKRAWKGAWYIYQIRCSIAHAGATGMVFEDYADAPDVIKELYPTMEQLVFGSLGLDF